jgi:hypothetical protein
MQTFKQYGYLIATFAMLCVFGVIISLSYCGGQTDAKMDARDILIEQQNEEIERLESAIDVSQANELKAIKKATGFKHDLELKQYSYDSLRKVKPKVIYRNLNVSDDSLTAIWASQIR